MQKAIAECHHHSSPRVILVEDRGMLCGLVTVKDVLRYIATEKPGHRPSWDERGGLDGLLEELWNWGSDLRDRLLVWGYRLLRRR
jgi:chloride channel 3/4/5